LLAQGTFPAERFVRCELLEALGDCCVWAKLAASFWILP
jgi:hypothetical protein